MSKQSVTDKTRYYRDMYRLIVAALFLAAVVTEALAQPDSTGMFSYSENNRFCFGCTRFRLDFVSGGYVRYECFAGCALPEQLQYRVPAARFTDLLKAFRAMPHSPGSQQAPHAVVADRASISFVFRETGAPDQVIDLDHHDPLANDLVIQLKAATEVDRYLKPSVTLYRQMVATGWNVNTIASDHQNALFSAVAAGDRQSVRYLLSQGSTVTPQTLEFTIASADLDIFRLILAASHMSSTDPLAASLLHEAARLGKPELLRILLDAGFNIESTTARDDSTPLMSAIDSGSIETTALLLDRGADVNRRDNAGHTSLWYAAKSDNADLITLLLRHGADVNVRDQDGRTPLVNAVGNCAVRSVRALLRAGADPDLTDSNGRMIPQPGGASMGIPQCDASRALIQAAHR
jgi:ankyrin repeat protein